MAVAGDGRLDLTWRVTEGRNASLRGSEKNHTANLRETQSRLHIECGEDRFECDGPGLKFLN